jgi:hypothetical protein
MKIIRKQTSDLEDNALAFGLSEQQRVRQALDHCIEAAERAGLSTMTMEEITVEVKAVRESKSKRREFSIAC